MATVRSVIQAAGRKIGLADMTPEELSDGMASLNAMLEEWSASPQGVSAITRETFSLVSGTASYTVGSGGDFDTTWPSKIVSAFLRVDGSDHPLAVFSSQEYAYTGEKALSDRPAALYYERTYPLGTFFFWPTPDASYTGHLYSRKGIPTYTSLDTTIALPPEYLPAITWNLPVEMAPEYEEYKLSDVVIAKALSTLATIKKINAHPVPQIRTDVIGRKASTSLFDGYIESRVGYASLPFILR